MADSQHQLRADIDDLAERAGAADNELRILHDAATAQPQATTVDTLTGTAAVLVRALKRAAMKG